ncbi:hypothetical protein BCR41DRAFT_210543 [Lobosporangium transversale]|uniref:Uncharacterized protein n=1 Tax=Lobosporangium transversale TaxID=64571 RepID=A0A1Y2G7P9_9FUNG|nr:hypothetical protein BCR41DRAFT_210543 [Lobosporangium transversale]ORZ01843.1 hypothetical protein BCR41DRAFT_210543 [Lobosporangium transversale]|eukprot:XP_021876140.1 hypothetical protein BCR41DRAFT_210543 [Lobosporangium transversale]
METLIKGILAQPTIPPQVKNAAIIKLLSGTASLSEADASILLDFAMELRTTSRNLLGIQTGDRVLTAVSVTHRDLFWARFSADWLESLTSGTVTSQDYLRDVSFITSIMKRKLATTLNEDDKLDLEKEMAILRSFAEKKCIDATPRLDYPVQVYIFGPTSFSEHEVIINVHANAFKVVSLHLLPCL